MYKNTHTFIFSTCLIMAVVLTAFAFQASWSTFVFNKVGFKLKFPERPLTIDENRQLLAKAQLNVSTFQVAVHYQRTFDLGNAQTLLKESVDGFINPSTDKILLQRDNFKVQSYPAREVRLKTNDGFFILLRTVITEKQLFQFVITSKGKFAEDTLVSTFLDSFTLL